MSEIESWAYRSVCKPCSVVTSGKLLSNSHFWRELCPRCGEMTNIENCRGVKRPFPTIVWYKPSTWICGDYYDLEFKS